MAAPTPAPTYDIIDVDTHITEPPDVWTARVPRRYVDRVPHVRREAGADLWYLGDEKIGAVGPTAPAGYAEPMPVTPLGYDDIHPAAWIAAERVKLMDQRGVWAEVLYPNVAGFGGQKFLKLGDPDLMLACVRAYNDFQAEWASVAPDRLIPTMATPFWDVDACVREIERCASLGYRVVNFTGEPQVFGLPYLGDAAWDRFWAAACDHDMVVSFHIGSGEFTWDHNRTATRGFTETYALQSVHLFTKNGLQVCDLLLSGVLPRFPKLRVVSVESGIGWIPFMFEALDHQFLEGGGFAARPEFTKLPSEYFVDQVYATFWFEKVAPAHLLGSVIPATNVLFETDFPHPTCLYENLRDTVDRSLAGVDAATRRLVMWENAQRLYRITPPPTARA